MPSRVRASSGAHGGGAKSSDNNTTAFDADGNPILDGSPSKASPLNPLTGGVTASAPLNISKKKQHQHLLMVQLRNAIYETQQAPPDGCTQEMVLERRKQLQNLLSTLERQFQQSKNEALDAYNNRWLKSMGDQLNKEKSTMTKIEREVDASDKQRSMFNGQRDAKLKMNNDSLAEKTKNCAVYLNHKAASKRDALKASMGRQQRQYDDIQQRRRDFSRQCLQKQIESERHCEDMLQRKLDRDEKHRQEKEDQAAARRRAAEERLEELKKRKEREAASRRNLQTEAFRKSNVRKIEVQLRPTPKLVVVEVPYEERLKRQNDAERDREEMVKRIKRELEEHRNSTVIARHHRNKELQLSEQDRLLREHEQRCKDMRDKVRQDALDAQRRKQELDAEMLLKGQLKDESISIHRQRHAASVHGHQDDTKRRVYDRWNRQLVQVSTDLGVEVPREISQSVTPNPPKRSFGIMQHHKHHMDQMAGGAPALPHVQHAAGNMEAHDSFSVGGANGGGGGNGTTFMTQGGGGRASQTPTQMAMQPVPPPAPGKLGDGIAARN